MYLDVYFCHTFCLERSLKFKKRKQKNHFMSTSFAYGRLLGFKMDVFVILNTNKVFAIYKYRYMINNKCWVSVVYFEQVSSIVIIS